MSVETLSPRARRFEYLDLIRLFCALIVVLFHYAVVAPYTGTAPKGFFFLPHVLVYGQFGVHVFFVISGFVITLSSRGRGPLAFLWARFLRLYPAYWICCALTALTIGLIGAGHQTFWKPSLAGFLVNLTMLQTYVGIAHVDEVYWSLAVELRFYAMVAIILAIRVRVDSLPLIAGWLAICAAAPFLPGVIGKAAMSTYAPYFIVGIVIQSLLVKGRAGRKLLLLVIALGLCARLIVVGRAVHAIRNFFPYDATIAIAFFGCGVALVLACAFAPSPRRYLAAMMAAGAVTYPLYLLHAVIGAILLDRLAPIAPVWVVGVFVTTLVIGASVLIAYVGEPALRRRLRAWGEAVVRRVRPRAVESAALRSTS